SALRDRPHAVPTTEALAQPGDGHLDGMAALAPAWQRPPELLPGEHASPGVEEGAEDARRRGRERDEPAVDECSPAAHLQLPRRRHRAWSRTAVVLHHAAHE